MKQVYAVGSLAARPMLAAATSGVRPNEIDAVLAASGYDRPTGDKSPVRLALLNTPGGRLLAHVSQAGDQLVTHALVDVPASADAQSAIQTWGSPQWQRHKPDGLGELPELPYLPVADVLDDDALRSWLFSPDRRDLLEFVFTALLATPAEVRVVVAAPADDLAMAVYAVTRSLPTAMLDDFTFSTYEPDPAACRARLIGTDATRSLDAARGILGTGAVVYQPVAGVRSELPAVPFAAFAVDAIAAGQFGKLDDLKALWQRLGLTDPRQFDLLDRLGRGAGVLTKGEAAEAVKQPAMAAWLSSRGDAVNQFLDWALDDRTFASGPFSRIVQSLRQKPEVLAKLGQAVRDEGVKALKAGDPTRTANALEVVLPMVAPTKAGAVWGDLVGQLADPDALPWAMRGYLLPKFARFRQQQGQAGVDPALAKWLSVTPERLPELLKLDLPRPYHLAAGRACLQRDGEPTEELARTLGDHPQLTLTLLRPETGDDAHGVALFAKLLAVAPQTPWLDDVVGAGDEFPPATRNTFLETALASGNLDAERLIRTRGPRVLELFAGQPGLDRLTTALLAAPPDDLLRSAPLHDFLEAVAPTASDPVKARIAAVRTAREFVQSPTFEADKLSAAAAAWAVSPAVLPASAKGAGFDAVAGALARRAEADGFQGDLEATLVHLGGTLANDPADLCENLLRDLRGRSELSRQPAPTTAFLAVLLGAAKAAELDGKLDGLDGSAFALASDAAKKGGSRLLDEIDRRTADWPKPARSRWGFLRTAVQPAGAGRFLRDAGFLLAGAAVGAVITRLL